LQRGRADAELQARCAQRNNVSTEREKFDFMTRIIANGKPVVAKLPCSIEEFLLAQKLLPRSVVVEHNGKAVAPSEFSKRQLNADDKLEIVKIVAGG
jgi:thiamine biosynthesis protein ThiS